MDGTTKSKSPRVVSKSVFDVRGSRLGIGVFDRPLLDDECRTLKQAWEHATLPGVVDLEVNRRQVSFLAGPRSIDSAWRSIDEVLATSSRSATS